MNMMRKRLISLNLAILMLLSLVLPAGAAELGEPAVVLTAEQPETPTAEPAVQADDSAEGTVRIYLNGELYGNAKPGETYVLPQLDGDDNNVLSGWNIYCSTQNGGYSLQAEQIDGRWQVVIPSSVQGLSLNPKYRFVGIAVVNGELCDFSGSQQYFRGTGWQLQSMSNDGIQLFLDGYDGGAIDVPAKILAVYYSGNNIVKGDTDAPALYSAGDLYFYQQCEEGKHATLTVTAGSGQSAVSAKRLDPAPHLTLTGGEDATALASETKLFSTGEYSLRDAEGNELTVDPTTVSYLKTEAVSLVAVINGNGGTADGGKTTLEVPYESCAIPKIEGLFQWSGHAYDGWSASRRCDETGKLIGLTYTIRWIDTKLEHFISFQTVYPIQEKETLSYDEGNGSGYLFCDNSEGQVIAPTVTYTNANHGVLAYWQTQGSNSEAIHQYRPGDTVKESDGTEFYASTIQPDRQVLLIGNGKNFDSLGRSMRVSDRAYRLPAADGSQLLSWNMEPDGSGTSYAPWTDIDLSGRTTPLVLYAQWLQKGKVAVYLDDTYTYYGTVDAGTTFTLPDRALEGCVFEGWDGDWYQGQKIGGRLKATLTEDGSWTVEIPADATSVRLKPQQYFNLPVTIDGTIYHPGTNNSYITGDGWRLSCSSDGSVSLILTDYDGGEIDIPTANLAVWLWGKNYITGSANGPALRGAGELYFVQNCDLDQNSHSELTITAGSGQNAISAKQIKPVAHIKLNGGEGAMAVNAEAEVVSSFMYGMCTKDGVVLTDDRYNSVQCLNVEPTYATVTINGNGGVAANNKTTLTKQYENGAAVPNLGKLFKKSGSQYLGADAKWAPGREHWGVIYGDGTLTARWTSTGYDRFVSFYGTTFYIEEQADYGSDGGEKWFFRDNSQTVTAPTLTFKDPVSCGNLVYWYPESSSNPECGPQYLPGETVNEADGTVLYPAVAYPRHQFVLNANGKTFAENGARVLIRNFTSDLRAADGTQVMNWNTEPNGSGEVYTVDEDAGECSELWTRDKPLVLYAQWTPEGEIKVTINTQRGSLDDMTCKPGTRLQLPALAQDTGYAIHHWNISCWTKNYDYRSLKANQDADGTWYVDIPSDAAEVTCNAYCYPTGTFNIGGTFCKFESPYDEFSGDGWSLYYRWWRNYSGVTLWLNGYEGGPIDLPADNVTIQVDGSCTITADAGKPAIRADSYLWLTSDCWADAHSSLTVTGSDGQPAISAETIFVYGAHFKITGGASAPAFNGDVGWRDGFEMYGGENAASVALLTAEEAQKAHYLESRPLSYHVTFRGSGGVTPDENKLGTLNETYEFGFNVEHLNRLFKKDGALYAGYQIGSERYDGETTLWVDGDTVVDILWARSQYPEFVGFYVDARITDMNLLDYGFSWDGGYIFRDNSGDTTVIAPAITYEYPSTNGNLVYWYVSEDGEESEDAQQYLPGDVVKEENGTALYPAAVHAEENVAFMSNGKTFENGKLALITNQCPKAMTATDGTKLIGWNTEKDGSGQAYAPGSKPDLSGRTEPLVLYAQWKPVYVAKVEEPKPNEPQTGGTLTIKPRPTPAPDPGTGTDPEPTEPEKPEPITEKQKVLVGVYRWGMMIAVLQGETDEKGEEIYCTVPKGLDLTGCALKLFVLSEAYAPDRKVEFILLSE